MRRAARFSGFISIIFILALCSLPACSQLEPLASRTPGVAESVEASSPAHTAETLPDDMLTPQPAANLPTSEATAIIPRTPRATQKAPTYPPQHTAAETTKPSTATQAAPCYRAAFLQDVTYPDGAQVPPGEIFLKIWRFRNDGACVWGHEFVLDFVGGERFSGPDEVRTRYFEAGADLEPQLGDRDWNEQLAYRVQPGEVVDLPVMLRAPLEEGRHRGFWRVLAEDGESVVMQFYVDIEVPYTLEQERGIWGGEWEHENLWHDPSSNPLVLHQDERQIDGYFYISNGEVFLVEASLSADLMRMEGSFGQVWQSGWPFVLELFSNQNVFNGYYNDSDFTAGAWCGSRSGYAVPLGECLLLD